MRKTFEAVCPFCHIVFRSTNPNAKYCCLDHVQADKPKRFTECKHCKKMFALGNGKSKHSQFCSRECSTASRQPPPNTCPNCGKIFVCKGHLKRKYCCRACSAIGRTIINPLPRVRIKIAKTCSICGGKFASRSKKTETCSRKCAAAVRSLAVQHYTINCAYCGKETITTARGGGEARKFCNMKCLRAASKPVDKSCAACGVSFSPVKIVNGKYVKDRQLVTCSPKCRKDLKTGPRSCNWQGGKTEYHRTREWRLIAEKARVRDKHTCQICGKLQVDNYRKLDVHHIETYHNTNNAKKAHRLSNLITLCQPCHRKEESRATQHHQIILPFALIAQTERRAARAEAFARLAT